MNTRKKRGGRPLEAPTGRGDEPVAKVFWSGRSQAVRLPKEFRVDDTELKITRVGSALLLRPVRTGLDERGWPLGFFDIFGGAAATLDLGDRGDAPERADIFGDRGDG
jgi:hypothetical protein